MRSLFLKGNAYALVLRNDRFEIDEIHLMDARQSSPQVIRSDDEEANGQVFFLLVGNHIIGQQLTTKKRWAREQFLVPVPAAPAAAVPTSAPAVKDYCDAVRRDFEALTARVKANGLQK